ncbi:galactokinase [Bacteroidota bacterium]
MKEEIKNKFIELFGTIPVLFKAPGRVNLIGEHTDYNEGFVLPAAIDRQITFAVAKNKVNKYRFYAFDLHKSFEINIENLNKSGVHWANYLLGVIAQFKKKNIIVGGLDCVFGGNIAIGAGLSSSAALEVGIANSINDIFGYGLEKMELIKMAQIAEHEYAGVMCGIMDQFASMNGKNNHVLKIDCRSFEFEYFPLELADYRIVLCDTLVKHSLASSEYNTRRKECETGIEIIKKYKPQVNSLRDISLDTLKGHQHKIDPIVFKRCKFVIEENQRLEDACKALIDRDLKSFGEKMYGSHYGLRDEYEVSCKELDYLQEYAENHTGVIGARMMGGGFGGCTINLVKLNNVDSFAMEISEAYKNKFNIEPRTFVVKIEDGAGRI